MSLYAVLDPIISEYYKDPVKKDEALQSISAASGLLNASIGHPVASLVFASVFAVTQDHVKSTQFIAGNPASVINLEEEAKDRIMDKLVANKSMLEKALPAVAAAAAAGGEAANNKDKLNAKKMLTAYPLSKVAEAWKSFLKTTDDEGRIVAHADNIAVCENVRLLESQVEERYRRKLFAAHPEFEEIYTGYLNTDGSRRMQEKVPTTTVTKAGDLVCGWPVPDESREFGAFTFFKDLALLFVIAYFILSDEVVPCSFFAIVQAVLERQKGASSKVKTGLSELTETQVKELDVNLWESKLDENYKLWFESAVGQFPTLIGSESLGRSEASPVGSPAKQKKKLDFGGKLPMNTKEAMYTNVKNFPRAGDHSNVCFSCGHLCTEVGHKMHDCPFRLFSHYNYILPDSATEEVNSRNKGKHVVWATKN